jgi:protein ImuB
VHGPGWDGFGGPGALDVLDSGGRPVGVDGRGALSGAPARVAGSEVVAWAGPWPVEERWWDPGRHRRQARLQVLTADGVARLLALEGGRWRAEALYD